MKRLSQIRLFAPITIVTLILSLTLLSCKESTIKHTIEEPIVLPYPTKVLKRTGEITLDHNFWVVVDFSDSLMSRLGKNLVDEISKLPGAKAFIADFYSTRKHPQSIILELAEDPSQHPQGYTLSITSNQIEVKASTQQGLFYGSQTILSILNQNWNEALGIVEIQKMVIKDKPISDFRVVNLVDIPDSTNMDLLISKLGNLKINGLIISENLGDQQSYEFLKSNNITLANHLSEKSISFVDKSVLADLETLNSDTVYFNLKYSDDLIESIELLVASQLGWSGNQGKGMDWLNSRMDNELEK